ncbi:MAG TPA: thiamine phosphate synthase, partial [Candidatus Aminicenantes bacterium]|nr:thiamine phosphate synthase [Candidatus Aminicenantes bacterium]
MDVFSSPNWKVCLIIDPELYPELNLLQVVEDAIAGGISLVQLRLKKSSTKKFYQVATGIATHLRSSPLPLIINDRVDIALACNAAGVHLGQDDLPLAVARQLLGPSKIIGISVNNPDEARRAEEGGADYLGVGPIFPTSSKENLRPLLGIEGLKKVRKMTSLPLLAIGGITPENMGAV